MAVAIPTGIGDKRGLLKRGAPPLPVRTRMQPTKTKFSELVFLGMQPTRAPHRDNYGQIRFYEAACCTDMLNLHCFADNEAQCAYRFFTAR